MLKTANLNGKIPRILAYASPDHGTAARQLYQGLKK
jgi:hypothetical protein